MKTSAKATQNPTSVAESRAGASGKTLPAVPVLQQKSNNTDEDPVQEKSLLLAPGATNTGAEHSQSPFSSIQRKANNTGLPDNLKTGVENISGFDMSDVRVHYNSGKPAQLQAHAFAQGTNIHVAPGQEKHLAHEAWHVVQQKQGRVKPTLQMKSGVPVNDDTGLEHEADVMGAKALANTKTVDVPLNAIKPVQAVAQRVLTLPSAVASDLMHPQYNNLFTHWNETINGIAEDPHQDNATKTAAIQAEVSRDRTSFAYFNGNANVPSLTNANSLIAMAGDASEHMYVHHGGTIYRADRGGEKRPHSTIVAGQSDPDVTCAGTLVVRSLVRRGRTIYDVRITTSSGHFRPANVPNATLQLIRDIARIGVPRGVSIGVRV
jgi:hypothetical protein